MFYFCGNCQEVHYPAHGLYELHRVYWQMMRVWG